MKRDVFARKPGRARFGGPAWQANQEKRRGRLPANQFELGLPMSAEEKLRKFVDSDVHAPTNLAAKSTKIKEGVTKKGQKPLTIGEAFNIVAIEETRPIRVLNYLKHYVMFEEGILLPEKIATIDTIKKEKTKGMQRALLELLDAYKGKLEKFNLFSKSPQDRKMLFIQAIESTKNKIGELAVKEVETK